MDFPHRIHYTVYIARISYKSVNAQKGFPGKEIDSEKEKNLLTYLWDMCLMAVYSYLYY